MMEWSEVSKLFENNLGKKTPLWNSHPIDKQLEILNYFFPIGSRIHYKNADMLFTLPDDISEYSCIVTKYELTNDNKWYLLCVDIDNQKTINKIGKNFDTRHPGFFSQSVQFLRDKKIDSIL